MIKLTTKLFKWKLNPKNNLEELVEEVENTKPVVDILWLRKKLDELNRRAEKLSGSWRR